MAESAIQSDESEGDERSPEGEAQMLAVETILDVRKEKNHQLMYLVKWEGFEEKDATWEYGSNMRKNDVIKKMIDEFRRKNPEKLAQIGKQQQRKRQKKQTWATIPVDEEPAVDDISKDREMQEDDECFGMKVGSLRGEAKGLIDFTHKTSQTELLLAKINPGERVTRRRISAFRGTNSLTPLTQPSTSTEKGKKPVKRAPRKTTKPIREETKETPTEDIFTTEDDGPMEIEKGPGEEAPKVEEPKKTPQPMLVKALPTIPKRKLTAEEERPVSQEPQKPQRENPGTPLSLPDFPVISKWVKRRLPAPPSNRRTVSPEEFRVCVEEANEKAIDAIIRQIQPKALGGLLSTHYANNENWLHKLLHAHKTCNSGHSVDGITRYICRFTDKPLLNEQRTNDLYTPVHMAVQRGLVCTLKTLLNYQPNLNIKNKRGQTSLSMAYEKNDPVLTKCLLEGGASFHALESAEASKPSTLRKDKAWAAIQTYKTRLAETVQRARNQFLVPANLEDVLLEVTSYMQQSGAASPVFTADFNVQLFNPPSRQHGYLLFIYVVSNNKEQWKARCWGDFILLEAPTLNGKKMTHAQNVDWPMVFHAGAHLENGHNRLELKGDIYAWRQECPLIVAHVVMVKKRPQKLESMAVVEQMSEVQQPLEKAPLCSPYM